MEESTGIGFDLKRILKYAVDQKASDIHIKPGKPPIVRINGQLQDIPRVTKLNPNQIADIARKIMNEHQIEMFRQNLEVDLAYSLPGVGRFRVNVYQQRGSVAISLRLIPHSVKGFEELNLPLVLKKIAELPRGLVIVTGATGSGKSTTLAAMIQHINNNQTRHIVTIEDPIEFLIRDNKSIISQREVGFDTPSFLKAIRSALRQDPDIILVGEMRDVETVTTALQAAETGHLVLSTLHTVDVMETINRILSFYPAHQLEHIRFELSSSLRAIICQRLVPCADRSGRVPALEIMINNSRIKECIQVKEKTHEVVDAMEKGYTTDGTQTFDMSLMRLVKNKLISYQDALENSTNPGDFALKFKGVSSTADAEFAESTQAEAAEHDRLARKKDSDTTQKMIIERFDKK